LRGKAHLQKRLVSCRRDHSGAYLDNEKRGPQEVTQYLKKSREEKKKRLNNRGFEKGSGRGIDRAARNWGEKGLLGGKKNYIKKKRPSSSVEKKRWGIPPMHWRCGGTGNVLPRRQNR